MSKARKFNNLDEIVAAALKLPDEQIDELIDRLVAHYDAEADVREPFDESDAASSR